jgi:hypothetical protein
VISVSAIRAGVLCCAVMVACDRPAAEDVPAAATEEVVDSVASVEEVPSATSSYDPALGAVLVLPLATDGGAGEPVALLSPLLPPDAPLDDTAAMTDRLGGGSVQLFSRSGMVGARTIQPASVQTQAGAVCPVWPTARLSADDAGVSAPARRWFVGFPSGRAQAIPLDSIEALPARDSAALAAALTRLVSALPEDSASSFRGLPFTVTRAYRSRELPDGFAVGVLVRRIPQEDRPLEERVFVVVSTRDTLPRKWSVVWHSRENGREEEVIATEPLAAVRAAGSARVSLVLGRDDGTGTSLVLLERVGERWRVRWESPVSGC